MVEMIITKSKIKEVVKDCNVGGDFADRLNEIIINEIKEASKRAEANGRKTIQAKDVFTGNIKAKEMLVVKSKVKEIVDNKNFSGDFGEALSEVVIAKIKDAEARAKANGRKTIGAKDL